MIAVRRKFVQVLAASAVILSMAGQAPAQERVAEISDNDWQPWLFAGNPSAPDGIAKEILKRCIPSSGYTPRFRHYPIPRMWEYMKSGQIDINAFSYKPEREQWFVYGKEPLFTETYQPFVRKNSGIVITKTADFDGLRLGHLNGLTYSAEFLAYIKAREAAGTLDVTTQNISNIKKLVNGSIDVFVNTKASMLWLARQMGVADQIEALEYVIAGGDYFVTLSKASPRIADKRAFLDRVDSCIRDLKKSGAYDELLTSYGVR